MEGLKKYIGALRLKAKIGEIRSQECGSPLAEVASSVISPLRQQAWEFKWDEMIGPFGFLKENPCSFKQKHLFNLTIFKPLFLLPTVLTCHQMPAVELTSVTFDRVIM